MSAASAQALAAAEETIARTNKLFIGNEYVEAEGSARLDVISPATGKAFTSIAHASAADVDKAVRSARACFDSSDWPELPAEKRAEVLRNIATEMRKPETLEKLSVMESQDCGKTIGESQADVDWCAGLFDYFADIAPKALAPAPLEIPEGEGGSQDFRCHIRHEPLGVVGCVTPWNYPLLQAVVKVAPALAAGCAVVLKPSPLASLTCCALGEIAASAGAPAGALNVITGGPPEPLPTGSSTGQVLIDHQGLDKISFTGSGFAGQKMLEASARSLRPTSLELGGKSAFLIFDDAEEYLESVLDWVMVGIFGTAGQICSATSRILVHKNLEEQFMQRLLEATAKLKVGDPMAEGMAMGPLISRMQQEKVVGVLERAKAQGCTVRSAALQLSDEVKDGFFVPPTVLHNVPLTSEAWTQEIFGPVLVVNSFESEEEAVRLANDTSYGLGNTVYSKDEARCARVAAQLKSGVVWENCSNVLFASTPFGGRIGKASGFGHEYGVTGLMEYVNPKTVVRSINPGYNWGAYPDK